LFNKQLRRRDAIAAVLAACAIQETARAAGLQVVPVRQRRRPSDESVHADILAHCSQPSVGDGRYTDAHETSHMISADVRMDNPGRNNGFYLLGGVAAVVQQPGLTIRDVADYVPPTLRGSRYELYLVQQQRHWNDEPLYILEEWHCYTLGAMTAVDDVLNNRPLQRTDAVSGTLEFRVYGAALAMAIKERCPDYWRNNAQFRRFLCWQIDESENAFGIGRSVPEFRSINQERFLAKYEGSSDGQRVQQFLQEARDI
jgi:hypothetical protein